MIELEDGWQLVTGTTVVDVRHHGWHVGRVWQDGGWWAAEQVGYNEKRHGPFGDVADAMRVLRVPPWF